MSILRLSLAATLLTAVITAPAWACSPPPRVAKLVVERLPRFRLANDARRPARGRLRVPYPGPCQPYFFQKVGQRLFVYALPRNDVRRMDSVTFASLRRRNLGNWAGTIG